MGELPQIIEKKDSKQLTEYLSEHRAGPTDRSPHQVSWT